MSGQLVITDTFPCPWERPYIFSKFNPLNTDRASYCGQQPALLEDFFDAFLICCSYRVRIKTGS